MPKLPKGMFRRAGRSGWYIRTYANGGEKVRALGDDFAAACDKARLLGAGLPVAPKDSVTVSDACGRWLERYVPLHRNEKGQRQCTQRVRDFIEPFFGTMELGRVTRENVREFRLWLESRTTLSLSTVGHVLSDVRCLFNWCEDSGHVERSPFPRRIMPRLPERLPDRLTDEEAEQVMALPEPWGFVCRFAIGTGLRWGELCRSQSADVQRLRIPGSDEDHWQIEVAHTKSGRVRRVPLSPELVREVRQKVGRLVPYAQGSPGSFANRVRRRTGIERFHVHQMRHTFGSQWADRGGDILMLKEIMGHASFEMTLRYARPSQAAVVREKARVREVVMGTA